MTIELSLEEAAYIQGLLKEPLEYYRLLGGNEKCTAKTRAKREFLENLWLKLVMKPDEIRRHLDARALAK